MKFKGMFAKFEKPGEKNETGSLFQFFRYLSFWAAIPFVYLPFSPNQITLIANITQIVSLISVIWFDGNQKLIGLFGYFVGGILDFVDGNIARYRNITSLKGVFYDQLGHVLVAPLFYLAITISAYLDTGNILFMVLSITVAWFVPLVSYQILAIDKYADKGTDADVSVNEFVNPTGLKFYLRKAFGLFYHYKIEIFAVAILLDLVGLLAIISTLYFVMRFIVQLYVDQSRIHN